MSAFTPGPWKVSGLGYVVARNPAETLICQPFNSIANAQLIAEAPALLAALRPFVEDYAARRDAGTDDLYDEQPFSVHVTLGDARRAWMAYHSAVKK